MSFAVVNPNRDNGRVTLITRYGADKVLSLSFVLSRVCLIFLYSTRIMQ
jgi:3-deoxy-D-arabino-heptulosonate 7-phosphate (DAHP) synthase class II